MCARLSGCLWEYFVGPALLWPLLEVGARPCSVIDMLFAFGCADMRVGLSSAYGISRTGVFRAVSSLCVIERLITILERPILCEAIACCLLAGEGMETGGLRRRRALGECRLLFRSV